MRAKPCDCALVAAGNDEANHSRTAGENRSSTVSVATAEEYLLGVPIGTLSAMPTSGEHHPAFEEYCECIYEMREDNAAIIQARLAERLNVSRASVSEMVKRMEAAGLIKIDSTHLQLAPAGEELAQRIVRRHRLAERFLTDVIGLSWSSAHHEACKWEHIISDDVEAGLNRLLGNPSTCPHGNPIPGAASTNVAVTALENVNVGTRFTLVRIPEDIEEYEGALAELESHHIIPGRQCTLAEREAGSASLIVHDVTDRKVTLTPFVSSRLLVTL
jgi:DtxR family transcriptional regulator, Mn-dependent transcriptional regulator